MEFLLHHPDYQVLTHTLVALPQPISLPYIFLKSIPVYILICIKFWTKIWPPTSMGYTALSPIFFFLLSFAFLLLKYRLACVTPLVKYHGPPTTSLFT